MPRQFIPPDNNKILKLTSDMSNKMSFRNKMGTKFVINSHLPIYPPRGHPHECHREACLDPLLAIQSPKPQLDQ
jgi:hypothetical protein